MWEAAKEEKRVQMDFQQIFDWEPDNAPSKVKRDIIVSISFKEKGDGRNTD